MRETSLFSRPILRARVETRALDDDRVRDPRAPRIQAKVRYDLARAADRSIAHMWAPSRSQIYKALPRLVARASPRAARSSSAAARTRPSTASHDRRVDAEGVAGGRRGGPPGRWRCLPPQAAPRRRRARRAGLRRLKALPGGLKRRLAAFEAMTRECPTARRCTTGSRSRTGSPRRERRSHGRGAPPRLEREARKRQRGVGASLRPAV